ncbi:aarF domain-containing protein kinase 1-like [Branchiostoma floridae x Branchiostoma belcheri]
MLVVRILKYGASGGLLGTSAFWLHYNSWDPVDSAVGLVRMSRAFATVARIAVDYKNTLSNAAVGTEEYVQLKSACHLRSAERLYQLCCVNRGCYIKVGQHIGALDYLLPREYVQTMKTLHSKAPQSSLEEVHQVIKEDLGKETCEIFHWFDEQPLGAASLAQVHRATLHDGTSVAIKVQHPKVQRQSNLDLNTMELLARIVARLFPEFQFLWLCDEAKKNLPRELDFLQEGQNCEKVEMILKKYSYLRVPKIHWELSTKRVLTMEFCQGGQINDQDYMRDNDIDVNEVTRNLGKLYSEMIFVQGFIHCDPHPGNVLVRKTENSGTEIVLLDHGLYQTLSDEFRLDYSRLWQAILAADVEGIKEYSKRLGAGDMYGLLACMVSARSWGALTRGIDKTPISDGEDDEVKRYAATLIPQISDLLNRVPRQMLLLFKTNDLLRGIEHALNCRANASSFINMSRCCVLALSNHQLKTSTKWTERMKILASRAITLWKIDLYEFFLWFTTTALVRWISQPISVN